MNDYSCISSDGYPKFFFSDDEFIYSTKYDMFLYSEKKIVS